MAQRHITRRRRVDACLDPPLRPTKLYPWQVVIPRCRGAPVRHRARLVAGIGEPEVALGFAGAVRRMHLPPAAGMQR